MSGACLIDQAGLRFDSPASASRVLGLQAGVLVIVLFFILFMCVICTCSCVCARTCVTES